MTSKDIEVKGNIENEEWFALKDEQSLVGVRLYTRDENGLITLGV